MGVDGHPSPTRLNPTAPSDPENSSNRAVHLQPHWARSIPKPLTLKACALDASRVSLLVREAGKEGMTLISHLGGFLPENPRVHSHIPYCAPASFSPNPTRNRRFHGRYDAAAIRRVYLFFPPGWAKPSSKPRHPGQV